MLRVLPLVLALVYLCPLDILGSLVLFYFLAVAKTGAMDQLGFSVGSSGQQLGSGDILDMESYGAIVCIALWSLWLARRHLREVWGSIARGEGDPADVRIYRIAAAGMAVSAVYVISFGVSLGASLPLAAATFALMTVSFFVTIKLIAATGFPYLMPTWANAKGGLFITDLVGSANLSAKNVVAFKLFVSQAFFGNIRLPAWPALPHHLRIFSLRFQPGRVCAVVLVAFPVGCLVASLCSITVAYDQGGAVHLPYAFNVYPADRDAAQPPAGLRPRQVGGLADGVSRSGGTRLPSGPLSLVRPAPGRARLPVRPRPRALLVQPAAGLDRQADPAALRRRRRLPGGQAFLLRARGRLRRRGGPLGSHRRHLVPGRRPPRALLVRRREK